MKELDPHNSELIERLKIELKETTHCDASWHSGVNDGMYRLLQYLIENKLVTGGSVPTPSDLPTDGEIIRRAFDQRLQYNLPQAWSVGYEVGAKWILEWLRGST